MPALPIPKHPEIERRNALICAAYDAKEKIVDIAKKFNLSGRRVLVILSQYNRGRLGKGSKWIKPNTQFEIVELYQKGVKMRLICSQFGLHRRTIMRITRRLGIEGRPTGRPKKKR